MKTSRGNLCENARIIYEDPNRVVFDDGHHVLKGYKVVGLDYCTRPAVLTTKPKGERAASHLCQECDADTAQKILGMLFSHCPDATHDVTGTRLDERGRLTLEEAWARVGERRWS
ncbi:hypothetical protein [Streptomyces sp. NRRL S-378]|uniref:hypothetical protein n=1 Tax=Streptomyces sp. NRRL S-378 TaxID=1463904 RepID=UPI0004C76E99|nr:hypothetical protein [Streptomyces sp. NRRL S-378]